MIWQYRVEVPSNIVPIGWFVCCVVLEWGDHMINCTVENKAKHPVERKSQGVNWFDKSGYDSHEYVQQAFQTLPRVVLPRLYWHSFNSCHLSDVLSSIGTNECDSLICYHLNENYSTKKQIDKKKKLQKQDWHLNGPNIRNLILFFKLKKKLV